MPLDKQLKKTLAQQEKMVNEFSEKLGKEVPGVKAIIGQAPDYVELAFAYLNATGKYLFGYDSARTKTPTCDSHGACVGFDAAGLFVDWVVVGGDEDVYATPLVVPVGLSGYEDNDSGIW